MDTGDTRASVTVRRHDATAKLAGTTLSDVPEAITKRGSGE
jgi:hypothetical protein